jgi:23S rRNA pseudouridine1911/1915/1917 synthase
MIAAFVAKAIRFSSRVFIKYLYGELASGQLASFIHDCLENFMHKLKILLEDNHLLALAKPAELPTAHGTIPGDSLFDYAKEYIRVTYQKPGNVYLGLVHRLDQPVSGIVLFAKTSKAASRLSEQFRLHTVKKGYTAIVEGKPRPPEGVFHDSLLSEDTHRMTRVVQVHTEGAKPAETEYKTIVTDNTHSMLTLFPTTGRKHQLRIQLGHRCWPVVGDKKYGSNETFNHGIALHAHSLIFQHPISKKDVHLEVDIPSYWFEEFRDLLKRR